MSATELPVQICGIGLLCPAGIGVEGAEGGRPGEIPGFRARAYIKDRKSLKLMTRSVKLGVSAIRLALSEAGGLDDLPPERRGLYVGASPQPGDPEDLRLAMERSMGPDGFDIGRFATEGYPVIHPLWLVRGLSNNVLGLSSATHNLQGTNSNYCDGAEGGWTALMEGALAIAEGRADAVIAGGADSLIGAESLLGGRKCGEGAAFVVFRRAEAGAPPLRLDRSLLSRDEEELGYLGAATWPVALARMLLRR
jgi:3-oxoacyl-(acyl-carrier-protein) synthase